jgi:hypothetical protein
MILEGMTREQALKKIWTSKDNCAIFMHEGKPYCNPTIDNQAGQWPMTEKLLTAAINAYFNEQEKPKWAEVDWSHSFDVNSSAKDREFFYTTPHTAADRAEIARTNAGRLIRAFIKANGGSGLYEIRYWKNKQEFGVFVVDDDVIWPGLFTCVTDDLAKEIIRRYPQELALLMKP